MQTNTTYISKIIYKKLFYKDCKLNLILKILQKEQKKINWLKQQHLKDELNFETFSWLKKFPKTKLKKSNELPTGNVLQK